MNLGAAIASKNQGFYAVYRIVGVRWGKKKQEKTPQGSPSCRVPVGLRFALNNRLESNSYECLNTH